MKASKYAESACCDHCGRERHYSQLTESDSGTISANAIECCASEERSSWHQAGAGCYRRDDGRGEVSTGGKRTWACAAYISDWARPVWGHHRTAEQAMDDVDHYVALCDALNS